MGGDTRVVHHNIRVNLAPERGTMAATDTMFFGGEGTELLVYLGKGFTLTEATQGGRNLSIEMVEEQRRARRYRLSGWDPTRMTATLKWEGRVGEFEVSKVCSISPRVVELSGFGAWFPTIKPSCYDEQFTYQLDADLPEDWALVMPGISSHGDVRRRHHDWQRPIEDIFICAAPHLNHLESETDGQVLRVYFAGLSVEVGTALIDDYVQSVRMMEKYFGSMLHGRGGVVVISPRSPSGDSWGFERGDLWVAGDEFVNGLVKSDWQPDYLPGPMSPSLHESIHSWIGLGLQFVQPWLAESITQYLQVVLSEELFSQPGLADSYFQWYVPRIRAALVRDDRAIANLTLADNPYDHWYLKGSWCFWDLESEVGRDGLISALAAIYRHHVAATLDYDSFVREMSEQLCRPLDEHFNYWFKERDFSPLCRSTLEL
ncbi:MAG: hypothetical protein WD024_07395 [Bacillota bacterium]